MEPIQYNILQLSSCIRKVNSNYALIMLRHLSNIGIVLSPIYLYSSFIGLQNWARE